MKKQDVRRRRRTKETPRAKVERLVGRKLLRGEISVISPYELPRCPVPSTHVKDFENCCKDYESGKISEAEVISRVGDMLKTLKKPEPPKTETSNAV